MIENLTSIKIKINLEDLNKLKIAVKNNFEKIDDVSDILENLPFLKNDIKNRLNSGVLFQPGRIVETMVIQSISNQLECKYTDNGIYENDKYIIKQDGGSGMSDLVIIDKIKNKKYIFEIKEPLAYGKSCGYNYDDNGNPVNFTSKNSKFREYTSSLFESGNILSGYNILENQGHNKIFEIVDIITNDFDYIISYDNDGVLKFMTIDEYKEEFSFRIEVRPCGRNTQKVFTPSKLNLVDGILFLDKNDIKDITQRGGRKSSRCKYISNGATFSFKRNDLKQDGDGFLIHINKIKQHVGEVSIQHFRKN